MEPNMMRIFTNLAIVSFVAFMTSISHLACAQISPNTSISSEANKMKDTLIDKPLKPFVSNFVAYRSGRDIGSANLKLVPVDNNEYELTYESKVSRFFLSDKRFEKTRFYNNDGILTPLVYDYKRTGTGKRKELSVTFDQQTQKIQVDNKTEMDWNGECDNQLFRVDLPNKLANGVTNTSYDFINYRGEKRHYVFEVVATDNLSLPYGQITAIKVKIDRESATRVTYAWFAPSLNFNLVRLQQFKNDKEQGDMQLDSFAYL